MTVKKASHPIPVAAPPAVESSSVRKALKAIMPPAGVRMSHWPPVFQVLLRLQSMQNKGKQTLRPSWLAKDLRLPQSDVELHLLELACQQLIVLVRPPKAVPGEFDYEFTFSIDDLISGQIMAHAACQRQRIRLEKRQGLIRTGAQRRYPWISFAQAAACLEQGTALAGQLGDDPALVEKLCRCVVRLGEATVSALVREACNADKTERIRRFFALYTLKRDELFPPVQTAPVP